MWDWIDWLGAVIWLRHLLRHRLFSRRVWLLNAVRPVIKGSVVAWPDALMFLRTEDIRRALAQEVPTFDWRGKQADDHPD